MSCRALSGARLRCVNLQCNAGPRVIGPLASLPVIRVLPHHKLERISAVLCNVSHGSDAEAVAEPAPAAGAMIHGTEAEVAADTAERNSSPGHDIHCSSDSDDSSSSSSSSDDEDACGKEVVFDKAANMQRKLEDDVKEYDDKVAKLAEKLEDKQHKITAKLAEEEVKLEQGRGKRQLREVVAGIVSGDTDDSDSSSSSSSSSSDEGEAEEAAVPRT